MESVGKQGLKIPGTVDDSQDANLILPELVEDQVHWKSRDRQPTRARSLSALNLQGIPARGTLAMRSSVDVTALSHRCASFQSACA